MADEVPDQDIRVVQPVGRASEWSFEWRGLLIVLLFAVVTVVGWRWLVGSGSGSDDETSGVGFAAAGTTEPVVATTEPAAIRSTTTSPTGTTAAATTTTTTAPGPEVHITGEMKPCRFGDRCLVASFTIEGFDEPSGRFTCIYPNSRRDFSFRDDGKADACLTADAGDTIAIEVDGVRSATISEDDLDGVRSATISEDDVGG